MRRCVAVCIAKLARAVKVTLGPKGRNVILQKSFGSPTVTKDGVTVAKEIELEDKYENMGARMVQAKSPARPATSPATAPPPRPCSPRPSYNEGLQGRRGRHQSDAHETRHRKGRRRHRRLKSDGHEDRHARASRTTKTSPPSPPTTIAKSARIIAEAMEKVGKDGVITVEEGKSPGDEPRVRRGHAVRSRLPVAVLRHRPQKMEVELEDPYILIYEKKISSNKDLVPVLEKVLQRQGKPILIICRGSRRAKPWRPWWSTSSATRPSSAPRSRPPATAIAARPCSKTSPSPHRRQGRSSKTSASTLDKRHPQGPGPGQEGARSTRTTRRSSKAPATRRPSRPASRAFSASWRNRPATTTAKS